MEGQSPEVSGILLTLLHLRWRLWSTRLVRDEVVGTSADLALVTRAVSNLISELKETIKWHDAL